MICRSNSSQMITGVLTAEITMRWKGNNSKGSLISSGSKWNSGRISKDNLINSAKWKDNSSQMITGVSIAEITVRLNGSKWKGNNNLKGNNSKISRDNLINSDRSKGSSRWKDNRHNVSKWNSGRISKDNLINSARLKGNSRCSKDNSSSKASQGSLKGDRTTSPGNLKTAAVEMTMAEVMAGDFNDI